MKGWALILTTTSSHEEAQKIAAALVNEKLAACVNIVDGVHSIYWWEGRAESASESLLIIKTTLEKAEKVSKRIKELHSYSVPEVLILPVLGGYEDYMKWVEESVK